MDKLSGKDGRGLADDGAEGEGVWPWMRKRRRCEIQVLWTEMERRV
jgi:hypothetical protein